MKLKPWTCQCWPVSKKLFIFALCRKKFRGPVESDEGLVWIEKEPGDPMLLVRLVDDDDDIYVYIIIYRLYIYIYIYIYRQNFYTHMMNIWRHPWLNVYYLRYRLLYFDPWPCPKILFQGDTPEGSDTFQRPVIERDRVGGLRLMIWEKVKVPFCHYSDAPE